MNTGLNRTKWEPYVWLLPSILLIAIFVVFPILIVFKLSFSEISKAGVIGGFIGFDNYVEAVHLPAFKTVMLNTLWWVLSVVILSTLLGFIIAMVLNQKFHGQKIARAIMVFPWATSLVIRHSGFGLELHHQGRIRQPEQCPAEPGHYPAGDQLALQLSDRICLGMLGRHFRHGSVCHLLCALRPAVHRRIAL